MYQTGIALLLLSNCDRVILTYIASRYEGAGSGAIAAARRQQGLARWRLDTHPSCARHSH